MYADALQSPGSGKVTITAHLGSITESFLLALPYVRSLYEVSESNVNCTNSLCPLKSSDFPKWNSFLQNVRLSPGHRKRTFSSVFFLVSSTLIMFLVFARYVASKMISIVPSGS